MTKLEEVRAKMIEVVPEIQYCHVCKEKYQNGCFMDHAGQGVIRPINLADVLRAIEVRIQKEPDGMPMFPCMGTNGAFYKFQYNPVDGDPVLIRDGENINWNLALPLDEQEPEVIEFLHKILV